MAFEVFFSLIGYRPYWRPGMHCFSHLDTKRPCLRVSSSQAPSLTGFCFTSSAFPLYRRSSTTQPPSNPQPGCVWQPEGSPWCVLTKLWSHFHGNRLQTEQRIHSVENLKSLENDKYYILRKKAFRNNRVGIRIALPPVTTIWIDKAKPRAIVGRKATGPPGTAGLPKQD